MKNPNFDKEWFKLDNAAKIYPGAKNSKWNAVFRISAVIKQKVDPDYLQTALEDIMPRFPHLSVCLRKGVFWYYLQYLDKVPQVKEECRYPASKFAIDGKSFLFRVLYSRNRITFECFHSLTDGTGALHFINTLLIRYFHLQGKKVDDLGNAKHYADNPRPEEVEDSFKRFADPVYGKNERKESVAYQLKGTHEIDGVLNVVHGQFPTSELKDIARKYGVTVNQYLIATVLYTIYRIQLYDRNDFKPIKVQVPVNLRGFFHSETLRNFSAMINVVIKGAKDSELSFDEILKTTKEQLLDNINKENMIRFINSNVEVENNFFAKISPLFLKSLAMKIAFYNYGEKLFTVALSNIGQVNAPEEFKDYIDRYEFILGAPKYNSNAISCSSFNGNTLVTFSRTIKETNLEREFFRFLSEQGIHITLTANRSNYE